MTKQVLATFVSEISNSSGTRKVTFSKINPSNEETSRLANNLEVFTHLQQMNVVLTNACNLSCSYCYEQHKTDYGRFDSSLLKRLYDFFLSINKVPQKTFTFFGGEPLAKKSLILEFLRTYKSKILDNYPDVSISIVTNGLLLDTAFLREYFSYPFSKLVISLDTHKAELDHRDLTQDKIDSILYHIERIPNSFKASKSVSVRCTLSKETLPSLKEFITLLHSLGIRSCVIHPLTMSLTSGYIEWDESSWSTLLTTMVELTSLPDMLVQFSEGIGIREHSNCMVGSDMIAVDASGDFSGCYFFTNRKEEFHDTILGNIFDSTLYLGRYKKFSSQYNKMFDSEECKDCHLNNLCYQCPAGNLATRGVMFRPDGMCKKVVRLFNVLQNIITKKNFFLKLGRLKNAVASEGEQVLSKALAHLLHVWYVGRKLDPSSLNGVQLPPYKAIIKNVLTHTSPFGSLSELLELSTNEKDFEEFTFKRLYEYWVFNSDKPVFVSKALDKGGPEIELFYLTLLHFFVLNPKGQKLESAARQMNLYEND